MIKNLILQFPNRTRQDTPSGTFTAPDRIQVHYRTIREDEAGKCHCVNVCVDKPRADAKLKSI